ncbi:putative cyclic nucleotide-binding domain-containing protein [Plasmopara halstedii]
MPEKILKHSLPELKQFPTLQKNSFLSQLHDQVHVETEIRSQRQREIDEICNILQRPPDVRDALEIDTLYDWVLKNGSTNKIFHGAQEIICKTICREMTLLTLPAQGVVCYQGDYGDTFYVIITGSVSLFIESKPKLKSSFDEVMKHRSTLEDEDDGTPKPDQHGTFIKHITEGGTFGELAVMDPTARRSCTVTCDVTTSFICLKRGAYQRLIRMTNSSHLDFTQIEYLKSMFFFEGWPHGELIRLSHRLRQVHFPANSYLTRFGAETHGVFFIYAGLVQETVPMIQFLNENGNIHRCGELESNLAKQRIQDLEGKGDFLQLQRRSELELSLYQDHDICAEYPIIFDKPTCTINLLAGKRETWKEMFFMHAIDYILSTYTRFRKLADARETWRKTRMKLALANPNLTLTISTRAMMKDGKCLCGWCGNSDHTTGDTSCSGLVASKKKQEDRKKNTSSKRNKKMEEVAGKSSVSLTCCSHAADPSNTEQLVKNSADTHTEHGSDVVRANLACHSVSPHSSAHRRLRSPSITTTAQTVLSIDSTNQSERPRTDPAKCSNKSDGHILIKSLTECCVPNSVNDIDVQNSDFSKSHTISRESKKSLERREEHNLPTIKIEDVRKGAFTEDIADHYKHEMVRKVKQMSCMKQYIGVRAEVLENLTTLHECMQHRLPRKPKIPKPRRPTLNPKTKQPRPDRFNRKINRLMRKIWRKDHPVPVVEESLRDL